MKHVFIVSFPRTATSGVYVEVCRLMKNIFNDCLCIYEPFNHNVLSDIFTKGYHVHDRVGEIIHDYGKLPNFLKELIYENSKWAKKWKFKRESFLGNYMEVLKELLELGKPLVLKDVYLWPKLPELVNAFKNVLFIVTVRNREYVLNSYLRWFRDRTLKRQAKNKIALARRKPYNLFNPIKVWRHIKTMFKLRKTITEKHMLGLGEFYIYFYGCSKPRLKGEELLKYYLDKDYEAFLNVVSKVENNENVYVSRFDNRLNIKPILDHIRQSIQNKPIEVEGTLEFWFFSLGNQTF